MRVCLCVYLNVGVVGVRCECGWVRNKEMTRVTVMGDSRGGVGVGVGVIKSGGCATEARLR